MYPANPAAERTLEFATGFLVQLISISESLLDDIPNDNENDRFISSVIDEVLEVCTIQVNA